MRINATIVRRSVIALLIIAAVLRIGAAVLLHLPVCSDAGDYNELARSLAAGSGFSLSGMPTAFRTPGYPLFLAGVYAVVGVSPVTVMLVQAMIGVLSCLLVFLIARTMFSLRVALLALGFMAFMPSMILYIPQLMTETLSVFLALLFLWHTVSGPEKHGLGRILVGGIVLGIGVLVRPTLLVLPVAIAAARYWYGGDWRHTMTALVPTLAVVLIVISPWIARNHHEFGRWTLTSNVGLNFWIGAHAGAGGGFSYPKEGDPFAGMDEFARSDSALSSGLDFVCRAPVEYAGITCRKISHLFSLDYWTLALLGHPRGHLSWALSAAMQLPFIAMVFLAAAGFIFGRPMHAKGLIVLIAVIAAWIVVHMIFFGGARYRLPMEPFFIIAGTYGASLSAGRNGRVTKPRVVLFTILSSLFLISWGVELFLNIWSG